MPKPKNNNENKNHENYFAWWVLAIAVTLIVVGIINAKTGYITIGWSIQSQHETYNNGWYFIFFGVLLGIGAILRLKNKKG